MPALIPTEFRAVVTYLGHVPDRGSSLRSQPLPRADLTWAGIADEEHGGETRKSCSRVLSQHPRGTEIRNVRQLSILSEEELTQIAQTMGLKTFNPAWVGASMVVRGIPDFTHIPPSSRLQAPSGATLVVDMENRPCVLPAPVIEADHPGAGAGFKPAAKGKRGVTAWVERQGPIAVGDTLVLHIPDQPVWSQLDLARP